MEQHNRKSYLAPPAPKAINRDGSRDSTVGKSPTEVTPRESQQPRHSPQPQSQSQYPHPQQHTPHSNAQAKFPTPTSGEIPLGVSSDGWPHGYTPSPGSARSPPMPTPNLSLEHLSLETSDRHRQPNGSSSSRYNNHPNINEPISAVEPQSRPFFPPRSASSHGTGNNNSNSNNSQPTTRAGLNSSTLPVRSAGAPPPPPPPASSSGPLRPLPALPVTGSSRGSGGSWKVPGSSGGREKVV
jgi:mitogen-activated protein kinase kinase